MAKRVLLVHGYEVSDMYVGAELSMFARAVCDEIVKVANRFDQILLLGGQHYPLKETIAVVMKRYLVAQGVPSEKLCVWHELKTAVPPRDTIEEVDVAQAIIRSPTHVLSAICLAGYARSVKKLYAARKMSVAMYPVHVELPRVRAFIARHLSTIDRNKKRPLVRQLLKWHRKKRTHMLRAPSVSTT